ncbi:EamA family transporter [Knoellia sp. CPCC 206453]|uniref:EamA family transporter n=1 Tax=Knoellia pratensis TaxID=3404796 RepID=UPI003618C82D
MPRVSAVPAPALVLCGIFSVQFGATLAALLVPRIGAGGSVLLRLLLAAVIMVVVARPSLRGHSRGARTTVLTFGLILGAMNFFFYSSLAYLPIGVAVTVEFIGPLALAAVLSRRSGDAVAVLCAGAGVVLVSRALEVPLADLEWRGLGLGLLTGVCWAAYIVFSRRTGADFPQLQGLAIALCIASVVVLPVGVGSVPEWDRVVLIQGLGIAVLSSVIPYSLELVALRRLSSKVFGILLSLEPAVAALAGFLVLRQSLSVQQLLGMALVVLASAIVLGTGARKDPAESTGS